MKRFVLVALLALGIAAPASLTYAQTAPAKPGQETGAPETGKAHKKKGKHKAGKKHGSKKHAKKDVAEPAK